MEVLVKVCSEYNIAMGYMVGLRCRETGPKKWITNTTWNAYAIYTEIKIEKSYKEFRETIIDEFNCCFECDWITFKTCQETVSFVEFLESHLIMNELIKG